MTADPFIEAARAEAERQNPVPPTYDPEGPSQWERLLAQQAFRNGAEWARAHLAAQEPTDAECIAFWHAFEDAADETNIENIRAALSAARAVRNGRSAGIEQA